MDVINIQLDIKKENEVSEESEDNLKESLDKIDPWMERKMQETNNEN